MSSHLLILYNRPNGRFIDSKENMDSRKLDILKIADEFFSKKGYAGTSINDILSAANTSKGNLYYHFENKQSLLVETLRYKSQLWADEWLKIHSTGDTSITTIYKYVELSALYLIDPLLNAVYDATRMEHFTAEYIKSVDKIFLEQQAILVEIIKKGIKAGELKQVKPELVADIIFAMICGLDDIHDYSKRPGSLRKQAKQAVDVLVAGLGA